MTITECAKRLDGKTVAEILDLPGKFREQIAESSLCVCLCIDEYFFVLIGEQELRTRIYYDLEDNYNVVPYVHRGRLRIYPDELSILEGAEDEGAFNRSREAGNGIIVDAGMATSAGEWEIKPQVPYKPFTAMKDGAAYCVGAVFNKEDLN